MKNRDFKMRERYLEKEYYGKNPRSEQLERKRERKEWEELARRKEEFQKECNTE